MGVLAGLAVAWWRGVGPGIAVGVVVLLGMLAIRRFRVGTDRAHAVVPSPDEARTMAHRRNHVICLDGTFNAPGVAPTNVLRLFEALVEDAQQIKRYYPGVGTRDLFKARSAVLRRWITRGFLGGGSGIGRFGAPTILLRAYFDFVRAYRPGDRIFIFGFSRGAATARALANYICETHGLPDAVEIDYMKSRLEADPVLQLRVSGPATYHPAVEFVGLWDTVAAMPSHNDVVPIPFELSIPEAVHDICHLVAIHEQRGIFDVKLIDADPRVEEIWFPGWHSNVGGGAEDSRLSDIALRYMMTRGEGAGLRFTIQPQTIGGDLRDDDDFAKALWDPRYWRKGGMVGDHREIRVHGARGGRPKVHESAYRLRQLYPPAFDPPPLPDDPARLEKIHGYGARGDGPGAAGGPIS